MAVQQYPSHDRKKFCRISQYGFSLIEVLISMFIFAVGILGALSMQSLALNTNSNAMQRSIANILAYDMFERMIANRDSVIDGSYNLSLSALSDVSSGSNLASQDIVDWLGSINEWLPGGKGGVECDSSAVCSLTIQWDAQLLKNDIESDGTIDDDAKVKTLTMVSEL
ncbi:type IV pilus modification protein PilV [Oceanobacter mangrovi]|uniref:type IV pilus modification protein PilV n=1 Tax=Oceanobacter mangrovi TaxID=2862510 RepID=UPI001C8D6CA7|nr:type IV pilus modification protein PilV [Oceanobacter mangrovi]